MAKKVQEYIEPKQPNLKVTHKEGVRLIDERIQKGIELRDKSIHSEPELERARADY